jgi:hypothetical protein
VRSLTFTNEFPPGLGFTLIAHTKHNSPNKKVFWCSRIWKGKIDFLIIAPAPVSILTTKPAKKMGVHLPSGGLPSRCMFYRVLHPLFVLRLVSQTIYLTGKFWTSRRLLCIYVVVVCGRCMCVAPHLVVALPDCIQPSHSTHVALYAHEAGLHTRKKQIKSPNSPGRAQRWSLIINASRKCQDDFLLKSTFNLRNRIALVYPNWQTGSKIFLYICNPRILNSIYYTVLRGGQMSRLAFRPSFLS